VLAWLFTLLPFKKISVMHRYPYRMLKTCKTSTYLGR
jgi:hypothetical protein